MLNDTMIAKLNKIASEITYVEEIESYSFMSCDCTGGCTDSCYDCAQDSGNQW